jgi:hypothetical protein
MPARTHGPLLEDYRRAIKAAKREGWKVVRAEIGGSAIAIMEDETYLEKLDRVHTPAPDIAEEAERERRSFTMKDW